MSWYARVTAPKFFQLFVVSLVSGSLLRFAKQFLDTDTKIKSYSEKELREYIEQTFQLDARLQSLERSIELLTRKGEDYWH